MKLTVIATLKLQSDEHKRYVKSWSFEKNEIAKPYWEEDQNFNWDQKKVD